jgi:2-amino-4-hydroxy-6-hydroxymethyldihydropteridine diphosphokinase
MAEQWTPCVVALGTNLGDREDEAFRALADIRATEGFRVTAVSSLLETVALGPNGPNPEAPRYLNQVILLESAWSPMKTLDLLLGIEQSHGRVRGDTRFDDRSLDLDLISYAEDIMDTPHLTLPHPRAHLRRFVLGPWSEVDPEAIIPGRGRVADALTALPADAP